MIDSGDDADIICAWYNKGLNRAYERTKTEPAAPGCCGATHEEWSREIIGWSFDESNGWKKELDRIARLELEWQEHLKMRTSI